MAVINQKGERYELTRDELGRISEEKDYWGNSRHYEYSPNGNLLKSVDPLGRAVEYITDKLGRITEKRAEDVEEKDYWGNSRHYEYSPSGNLLKSTDPLGRAVEYITDKLGRITEKRAEDVEEIYEYDDNGNLVKAENR